MHAEPKGLHDWVQALPLANGLAAARSLLQTLRDMNATRMDGLQRLAGLELLRSAVSQMVAQADRQVVGSSFPLPQSKQLLGLQSRDFHEALALGFRMAVFEICLPDGKIPFLKGKQVATALQRAISHHGEQLLRGYLLYAAPQAGVWQHLHDLYRFAEAVGVHEKSVDDPVQGKLSFSAKESYAHVVLCALCNPYRLSQKEMVDGFELTRVWAPLFRMGSESGASEIGLSMEQDLGPGYVPEERDAGTPPTLKFDTNDISRAIARDLALAVNAQASMSFRLKGGNPITVSQDFVQRLSTTWKPAPDRYHARLTAGHYLDTLIGLHGIHYHLAGGTDFEKFVREIRGPGISMTERDKSASWMNALGDSAKPAALRSKVLDQSLGGYRLEWGLESGAKARIGELVGLAAVGDDNDDEREWMIGVIRWLRFTGDGRVQAGIELLAREAYAAAVRAADTGGHFRAPVRAIELQPMRNGIQSQLSILTPSMVDRGMSQIEVSRGPEQWSDSRDSSVRVLSEVDVIENTGAYIRLVPKPTYTEDASAEAA
jgi:cyclic-di-GMP-binding protein